MIALLTSLDGPPLDPTADQARQWAFEELARREYQQSQTGLTRRALEWVLDQLNRLFNTVGSIDSPGSALALGVVVAVIGGLIWLAVWRFGGPGPLRAARRHESIFADAAPVSAAEHRRAAEQAERDGRWQDAVLERFRALVRELEEATVLTPRPGLTADEAASDAGRALPDLARRLAEAARAFDDVHYGGVPATPDVAQRLAGIDAEVGRALRAGQAVLS